MIKILTKEQKEVLAMCKPIAKEEKEDKLMFVDLGRDMFEGNEYILNKYFRNENLHKCYYANLLAFRDIPNITVYEIKRQLKKDFGKSVSLAGYKYNPEHYRFADCYIQEEYEEDLFKCKSKEDEEAEFEADRRAIVDPIDFNAVESLYAVLFKAIKARLVMILNLEDIPGLINNAFDCYYKGITCSACNGAMYAKIAEIRKSLENPEVIKWLKTKPTDISFDKYDYINTYQKVLRQLTGISNETVEYCRDLLENSAELWIEDIIKNDYIECNDYIENNYTEDEDDYEYNYLD